jgi:hypothetical protein
MFMSITPYSCHILLKLEYSQRIIENMLKRQIVDPCRQVDGRTDRHDATNSRIYVNAPVKYFTNVLLAQYI